MIQERPADTELGPENPFRVGEPVLTRRMKSGTVTSTTPRTCGVQFWENGPIREMPWTALVSETAYKGHGSTSTS